MVIDSCLFINVFVLLFLLSSQRLVTAASGSGPWCGCRSVSLRIGSQKGQFVDKYAIGGLILPFSAIWGYPWEPGIAKEAHRSAKKRLGASFQGPFWVPFWAIWAPCRLRFGGHFSILFWERSWSDLGSSSARFGINFGLILAPFWDSFGRPCEK